MLCVESIRWKPSVHAVSHCHTLFVSHWTKTQVVLWTEDCVAPTVRKKALNYYNYNEPRHSNSTSGWNQLILREVKSHTFFMSSSTDTQKSVLTELSWSEGGRRCRSLLAVCRFHFTRTMSSINKKRSDDLMRCNSTSKPKFLYLRRRRWHSYKETSQIWCHLT